MKILNFAIAVFSVIFGFFGVIAGMILPACERIAVFGIAVRQRIRVVGIAVAMILMVGVTASALASENQPPLVNPPLVKVPLLSLPLGRTLEELAAYDPAAAVPPNPYRLGNSPFPITEKVYRDSNGNPTIIVSSLQYANAGVWSHYALAGASKMKIIDNYVVAPPPTSANIGMATYLIEGKALYRGVRYYPDGYVQMNFNAGTFTGRFSADGEEVDDDFGPDARLPDGSRVDADDKFVVELSGNLHYYEPGGLHNERRFQFRGDNVDNVNVNIVEASGFFAKYMVGSSGWNFYGAFHDAADYDNTEDATDAPAELSAKFVAADNEGVFTESWFLGRWRFGPFPNFADTVMLSSLYEFDPRAVAPVSAFRKGDSDLYPIAEKEYRDTDSPRNLRVVVQSFQYANLGVWVDGDASAVGDFEYASLASNMVKPTISESGGEAVYIIEGDAVYKDVRFYPDGYLNADFVAATISGQISIRGTDAADDFGDADVRLPDGNGGTRPVATDDILVMDLLSGPIESDDGFEFSTEISIAEASGFFARFRTGKNNRNGLYGRFYDASSYTGKPAEVAGNFEAYETRTRGPITGGFLGRRHIPLPDPFASVTHSATLSVTLGDLEEYDRTPTILLPDKTRAGGGGDKSHPTQQTLSINGQRFDNFFDDDSPQVLVQMLEHAYLGVWMYGDPSAVTNFVYQSLDDNVVKPPTTLPSEGNARYDIEGEVVYKNYRFYPDGELIANFDDATMSGLISIKGNEPEDDLGAAQLDGIDRSAALLIGIPNGEIVKDVGFKGNALIYYSSGFFSDFRWGSLHIDAIAHGRFHDADDYNQESAPAELSGDLKLTDSADNVMQGGFLGKKE